MYIIYVYILLYIYIYMLYIYIYIYVLTHSPYLGGGSPGQRTTRRLPRGRDRPRGTRASCISFDFVYHILFKV